MANNIKYYRLGKTTPVTYEVYQSYCPETPDGRIVFAQVAEPGTWDVDTSTWKNPQLYIWANGLEYKLADKAALDYALSLISILNGLDTSVGSVAYQIKKAFEEYHPTAEDIARLIDASSNVKVEVVDSSLKLTVDARKATITVGTTLPETAQHGDYYVVETPLADSSIPMRTAYIWDETKGTNGEWVALDGNVNAENVYFPTGVQRNAEWGVKAAQTSIATECSGKNLKDLLEYYLVEEIYETGVAKNATFAAPSFSLSADTDTMPNALYTYVKVNNTTMTDATSSVQVGSTIAVNAISLTEKYTYDTTASKTGTAPTITYSTYNKYSTDGTAITDGTTLTGITPAQSYTYDDTLTTATAELKLTNNSGCTNIDNQDKTATNLSADTALATDADTDGVIVEGENKLTLAYTVAGATATRTVSATTDAATISAYGISNKNNVSTGYTTANGTSISTTATTVNANGTTATSTVTITGVYQFYTDGGSVKTSATNKAEGSYSSDPLAFGIINYFTSSTITRYVQFGACNAGTTEKHEVYLPQSAYKTFTITRADYFNPLESATDKYTDHQTTNWTNTGETKVINGVTYDIWRNSNTNGANECCIVVTVANK